MSLRRQLLGSGLPTIHTGKGSDAFLSTGSFLCHFSVIPAVGIWIHRQNLCSGNMAVRALIADNSCGSTSRCYDYRSVIPAVLYRRFCLRYHTDIHFGSKRRNGHPVTPCSFISLFLVFYSPPAFRHIPCIFSVCICLKRIVLVILPRIPFRSILGWGRRFIPEIIRFIIWNPVSCYGNILNSLSCGKIKHIAAWIYYKTKLEFFPFNICFSDIPE